MKFEEKKYWDRRVKKSTIKATGIKKKLLHEYSQYLKWNIFEKEYKKFKKEFLHKKAKILDVGCGYGYWSMQFAKDNFDVIGIDISKETVKNAKLLAKKKKYKINYLVKAAENMQFKNEFDLAVSVSALQHIIDNKKWEIALENVYKALKKGGKIIMIESASIFPKKQKAPWKAERTYWYHKKVMKNTGFKFVKSYTFAFNGYYLFWILEYTLPKKFRNHAQNICLRLFKKIDLFLSQFNILKYLYYPKMMVFQK